MFPFANIPVATAVLVVFVGFCLLLYFVLQTLYEMPVYKYKL
jgi:hypothetical protein